MWYYSIELKAVAEADVGVNSMDGAKNFMTQVAVGLISKTLDNLISDTSRMIPL